MISLLHLADLHLDTPFKGLSQTDSVLAQQLRDATLAALDAAVNDAVAFTGDIFDRDSPSLRARRHFSECVRRLCDAGLHCYVVAGNHDPYDDAGFWRRHLSLPSGAVLFPDEWEVSVLERHGQPLLAVFGRSFSQRLEGKDPLAGFEVVRRSVGAPLAIGLLHGDVGNARSQTNEASGFAPVLEAALRQTECDAWLLGHIHRSSVISDGRPWIGYPGNPQGRDINEEGWRGGLHLRIGAGGVAEVTHVPLGSIRWVRLDVSVQKCANDVEVVDVIRAAMEKAAEACEGVIARISLTGRVGSPELWKALSSVEALRQIAENAGRVDPLPFLLVESILPRVERPLPPRDVLLQSGYPIGDFLRLVDEARQSADSRARQAVANALAAAGEGLGGWSAFGIDWDELLKAAEDVALVLLSDKAQMAWDEEESP
jgi:DNA repair exonuclease SbcCD nuclease subunit